MIFLKNLKSKHRKTCAELSNLHDSGYDNYLQVINFCKKQEGYRNYILSVNPQENGNIHIIHGDLRFYTEANFSIFLHSIGQQAYPVKLASILGTLTESGVFINDVETSSFNKGYETLLIDMLISICRDNNISSIYGELQEVDLNDHRERLLHFWSKAGFTITGDSDNRKHIINNIIPKK